MLSPEEFIVGNFKQAEPGSLVFPRTAYEELALICEGDGDPIAVFLSGDYAFQSFRTNEADNWKGIIVPNVRIEVDELSAFDLNYNDPSLGAMIREKSSLFLRTKYSEHRWGSVPVVVQSGLPECQESAEFTKWQIVIGNGDDKRVLHMVDLNEKPKK